MGIHLFNFVSVVKKMPPPNLRYVSASAKPEVINHEAQAMANHTNLAWTADSDKTNLSWTNHKSPLGSHDSNKTDLAWTANSDETDLTWTANSDKTNLSWGSAEKTDLSWRSADRSALKWYIHHPEQAQKDLALFYDPQVLDSLEATYTDELEALLDLTVVCLAHNQGEICNEKLQLICVDDEELGYSCGSNRESTLSFTPWYIRVRQREARRKARKEAKNK